MTEAEYQQFIEDNRIAGRQTVYYITDTLAIRLGMDDYDYKYIAQVIADNERAGA